MMKEHVKINVLKNIYMLKNSNQIYVFKIVKILNIYLNITINVVISYVIIFIQFKITILFV